MFALIPSANLVECNTHPFLRLGKYISFSVVCQPNHYVKEQTETCPGQEKFKSYLSQEQARIQLFSQPLL